MSTKETTIQVRGMTCGQCVHHVTSALRAQPGVHSVAVELADGVASVTFDPDESSRETLRHAITEVGYEAV